MVYIYLATIMFIVGQGTVVTGDRVFPTKLRRDTPPIASDTTGRQVETSQLCV